MNKSEDLLTRISKWLMPSMFLSPGASRSCDETMQREFGHEPHDIWLGTVDSVTLLDRKMGGVPDRLKFALEGQLPACGDRGRLVCHIADGTLYAWGKVVSVGEESDGTPSFIAEVSRSPTLVRHGKNGECYWRSSITTSGVRESAIAKPMREGYWGPTTQKRPDPPPRPPSPVSRRRKVDNCDPSTAIVAATIVSDSSSGGGDC